jgi:hypothetical protein
MIGRESEFARLHAFVERVPQGSCALLLEGEAGALRSEVGEQRVGVGPRDALASSPEHPELLVDLTGQQRRNRLDGVDQHAVQVDEMRNGRMVADLGDGQTTRRVTHEDDRFIAPSSTDLRNGPSSSSDSGSELGRCTAKLATPASSR